jgi:hypothetical protein
MMACQALKFLQPAGSFVAGREEFLRLAWEDAVNGPMTVAWIDNTIAA